MENKFQLNQKSKKTCFCQCHIQNSLCCYVDCYCCPFLYCNHESNTNLITNSYKTLESPRIIIPQKEKDFFIKSEKRSKIPFFRNKITDIFQNKSNTERIDTDIENINKNNHKKYYSQNNIKPITSKKPKPFFKKIRVNKNNQEKIYTNPLSTTSRHKKSIDINNYFPNSVQRNKKVKQINNYDLDKTKKIFVNKKLDLTNINNKINLTNPGINFNSPVSNKISLSDKNDDIINIKQDSFSPETNDNRKILQTLKNEIDKTQNMINNLKSENKKLKLQINQTEQNNTNNSQMNNLIKDRNDNDKNINEIKLQNEVNDLKGEINELKNKINEYENFVAILKKRNMEQEKIIENKDKEILDLIIKLGNYEKSIQSNETQREQLNISYNNYKNINDNLKSEILELKQIEENKNNQIKELEIKLKFEKNFNNKKQKILELLFNFYQNLKKAIKYDKQKVLLKDVIDIITVDDFQSKLNKFEKKVIQIFEDMQIKYGHCFACDIACCTSHVDKLKAFRQKVPKKK